MRKLTLLLAIAAIALTLPACDAFGGGGDPTIGGTYTGTGMFNGEPQSFSASYVVPADTDSDPDASFAVGLNTSDGRTASPPSTGTYDYPTLLIRGNDDDVAFQLLTCSVEDDGAAISCTSPQGNHSIRLNRD